MKKKLSRWFSRKKKPVKTKILTKSEVAAAVEAEPSKKGKQKSWKKYLRWAAVLGVLAFFLGILSFAGLYLAVRGGYFGDLPQQRELMAIKNPIASEVYSSDGVLLGRYYRENRTNVSYDKISKDLINALVATEDARFFKHKGVDTRSYFRVLIKSILLGDGTSGGGSTISQQLTKNLFPRKSHGLLTMPVNKIREAIIASRMEKLYSKEDILTLYLNTVPFGERVYGVDMACKRFFSTNASLIKTEQAATLIGMLKATTYFSPRRNPERALGRRNVVLDLMVKNQYLNADKAAALKSFPLGLAYNRTSMSDGLAPHFRQHLKNEISQWAKDNPRTDGSIPNVNTDGLRIYTSIDSKMQTYAEEAVATHMKQLQSDFNAHWKGQNPWGDAYGILINAKKNSRRYKNAMKSGKTALQIEKDFNLPRKMTVYTEDGEVERNLTPVDSIKHYLRYLNTGFLVMDHETGHIKSWVGSIDHEHFPYDHTRAQRQVGSTFKPIVYAAALERGTRPCQFYKNELRQYNDFQNWTPENSDGDYEGEYSLMGGLANSVNTISVQILFDAGMQNVIKLAKKLGIKSDIPEVPSIALGAASLSLQEMVQSYAPFANGGYKVEPTFLLRIEDGSGNVLANFAEKGKKEQVLTQTTSEIMVKLLEAVVDSGTGRRLRFRYNLHQQFGGKTGTTQNHTDGWFIGISPRYVAGAWTGGQTNSIRFRSISLGQGANMALPIFGEFFRSLYDDPNFKYTAQRNFREPGAEVRASMVCQYWREGPDSLMQMPNPNAFDGVFGKKKGTNTGQSGIKPTKPAGKKTQPIKPEPKPVKKKKKKRKWKFW